MPDVRDQAPDAMAGQGPPYALQAISGLKAALQKQNPAMQKKPIGINDWH